MILVLVLLVSLAHSQPVLLSLVEAITLHANEYTASRRVPGVPQLQCMGRYCERAPRTVQCTNMGTDGIDAQWRCVAELSNELSFDQLDVSCEGYDHADDPYILAGSCGLQYSLKSAPQADRVYYEQAQRIVYDDNTSDNHHNHRNSDGILIFAFVFFIFFVGFFICAFYWADPVVVPVPPPIYVAEPVIIPTVARAYTSAPTVVVNSYTPSSSWAWPSGGGGGRSWFSGGGGGGSSKSTTRSASGFARTSRR